MLEIDAVTRRFGDLTALDDVSFTVPDGAFTGFVGGNGAGKTTTMRIIMGVLALPPGRSAGTGSRSGAAIGRSSATCPRNGACTPNRRCCPS
ncbi:ATP-binding cassette domain-containing protein [Tessaracoccus sp. HDW20]|nr:ATP-binding cassette domain-containing protein [Tessaracoccus coleopterorum]